MPDEPHLNFEEAIHGLLQTRTALERAQACVNRLEQLLTEQPRSFAPLAEPAFRLRDRLIEDLETLEARLAEWKPVPSSGPKPSDVLPRDVGSVDGDRPLGDEVMLGSQ